MATTDSGSPGRRFRFLTNLKRAISGWNALGTLTLISGVAIGIGVPVWQDRWVQRPVVSIEMNSIKREISAQAKIILDEYPELLVLRSAALNLARQRQGYPPYALSTTSPVLVSTLSSNQNIISLDELSEIVAAVKREATDLPGRIDEAQKALESVRILKAEDMTVTALTRLNITLISEIDLDSRELNERRQNISANTGRFKKAIRICF